MGSVPLGFLITTSVIFIIVAAILVAAESSLSRLSKAAVEDLIEEGQKRAKRLDTLLDQRRSTALSVRAGRIALQTAAAVAITIAFTHGGWPWWVILLLSIGVNWLVAYFVISVIPQQIAWRNPEKVALHTTPLLEFMLKAGRLGSPIVELFRKVLPASPQTDAEARAEMTEEMRGSSTRLVKPRALSLRTAKCFVLSSNLATPTFVKSWFREPTWSLSG